MYNTKSFGLAEAQAKLSEIKGRFQLNQGAQVAEVNDILEKVIFALNVYEVAPKFVLTRALYDDKGVLVNARFVVRPSAKHTLKVRDMKKTFAVNAGPDFFDKFIQNMAEWFDEYARFARLESNVTELNAVVAKVVEENEIPFAVEFSLGDGLVDVTDSSVVVGLHEDVVMKLGTLPLFDENVESRQIAYKAKIAETLKECVRPYDIVKTKSQVTKDLDIYSRRAVVKLIRQIVNRKAEYVREGIGYVETAETFAVVEKVTATEEAAAQVDAEAFVMSNNNMTASDKKKGENKLIVTFRVSPFNKETGVPVQVGLADLMK